MTMMTKLQLGMQFPDRYIQEDGSILGHDGHLFKEFEGKVAHDHSAVSSFRSTSTALTHSKSHNDYKLQMIVRCCMA